MVVLNNQVGLNITDTNVQFVEIINRNKNYYLENVDEEFFEESIFENTKEAKYIHILQNAFNEIVLRKPLNSNLISVTFPPSFFKVFEIPIDKNLTKNDVNEYIKWELTKLFPTNEAGHFSFQKVILNPLNFESFKRTLIFSIPNNLLRRVHKFCSRNNLKLNSIDHAQIAASGYLQNFLYDSPQLSIYVEEKSISVILFSQSNILYHETVNFNESGEISQKIKIIIEDIIEGINDIDKVDKLFLFGNFITPTLKENIEKSLNVSAEIINPFLKLTVNEELTGNKFFNENSLKFSPAAAIALRN